MDVGDVEVQGANDPSDAFPDPQTLLTIDDDFGGWADANTKYFDEAEASSRRSRRRRASNT